jgi:S-formylglutathione hydrolase
MERVSSNACFGGRQEVWQHDSAVLGVQMRLGVYLPPQAAEGPCPVLYFLSGLTCTEQNVITKGGFQQHCARHGIILVCPDTSPRGEGVADDEGWDLGQGAGFYVNATQEPWARHYRMDDYVVEELPELVQRHFPATAAASITGHSMGGHGALVLALRNPDRYASVSAFAPIVAPSQVPWGEKAFGAYIGGDRGAWARYDATELVRENRVRGTVLIDQGTADGFLEEQLQPERFATAAAAAGQDVVLRMQEGYDHSYYFISTFAGDHVAHAAAALSSR